ncbi:MAG: protein kinase, partial [Chloroflexi bacterium]|nr:protein kinase [Chloroflexota bacterium]
MEDLVGRSLGSGRYRLLSILGRGGMATVYEAEHTGLHRRVAIKVLDPALTNRPDFVGRFQREAETIAQLEHPHILPVYDTGEEDDLLYLVMFLARDGTLKNLLRTTSPAPWSAQRVLQLAEQILPALDVAHQQGVIHRDIKPDNILLSGERAFLADFGIAKLLQGDPGLTVIGTFVGTPEYAAPEQVLALPLDGRSDLYAFGVVLYELLVGHVPYRGETPMGVALQHVQASIPSPTEANPNLPEPIGRVLLNALAKERDRRYATGAALVAALREAVHAAETEAARGGALADGPTAVVAGVAGPSSYPGVMPPDVEAQREAEAASQAQAEAQRQAEVEAQAEAQRQAELERQRQAELEAQRQAELERQHQAELEAQAEAHRQAELERQHQAEVEAQAEAQRQADLERQRQAELEAQRQAELQRQRQAELDAQQRAAEAEARRQADLERQKTEQRATAAAATAATGAPAEAPAEAAATSDRPRWLWPIIGIAAVLLILAILLPRLLPIGQPAPPAQPTVEPAAASTSAPSQPTLAPSQPTLAPAVATQPAPTQAAAAPTPAAASASTPGAQVTAASQSTAAAGTAASGATTGPATTAAGAGTTAAGATTGAAATSAAAAGTVGAGATGAA